MTTAAIGLGAVAALVVPAIHLRAQSEPEPINIKVEIDGFQPDPSSPFEVTGDYVGTGVWQHLVGPLLGPLFTSIPGPSGFTGSCQSEYSQDQIFASDGSTLLVEVTGIRCETTPGTHRTFGAYSPVSGTGRFQVVTAGTGPITIDVHADGSSTLFIGGVLHCVHRINVGSATGGAGGGR